MSIERIPNGYLVRWRTPDGRHPSRTFRHGDGRRTVKQVAEDFHDEVRHAKRYGATKDLERTHHVLGDVAAEWAAELVVTEKTKKLYDWLYRSQIAPYLAKQPVREISVRDVERWFNKMNTGDTARRKAATLLGQILDTARRWGYCQNNPVRDAKLPRPAPRKAIRPPTPTEVELIRSRMDHGDATLVSVLAYAGLRPQEALALRWADIRSRTVLVDAPKTGKSRAVRLLAPLAQDLREWKLALGPSDLVFPSRYGTPLTDEGWGSWRARVWKPVAPAGLRPYDLRHLFVSLLIREGLSIVEVAAQAGHSPKVCLDRYAHEIAELQGIGGAEDEIWRARGERMAASG